MQKRIVCVISGRVQGVFYRAFTEHVANSLGIKGEVKNLPDGTVRVVAEGDEEKLDKFKIELQKGSKFSRVENVVCESGDNLIDYNNFRIKYRNFFDRF